MGDGNARPGTFVTLQWSASTAGVPLNLAFSRQGEKGLSRSTELPLRVVGLGASGGYLAGGYQLDDVLEVA